MRFNHLVFISSLFISSQPLYSQTSSANIYEWFDSVIGQNNSLLNNGPVYFNLFKTLDPANNPFFIEDKFVKGDVYFDGQPYYNVDLKYDIHNDYLLIQPFEGGYYKSVRLISENTESFMIYGKKFKNLSNTSDNSVQGYYEEAVVGPTFTFYIKHHKQVTNIIKDVTQYSDFKTSNDYFVLKNGTIHKVSSKQSITALFPLHKPAINAFYNDNKRIKDKTLLMQRVFSYISTITQ